MSAEEPARSTARRALTIVLGVVAVAALLAVGAVGVGWTWLQQNQERLRAEGAAVMKEGARFGSGQDGSVCVAESLRRLGESSGIIDEAKNKRFLSACLQTAVITPALCEGVPPRDQILASATWALDTCKRAGHEGNSPCTRLVGAIQEICLAR